MSMTIDELDDDRREKLRQFQEIVDLDDVDESLATLASVDWDLQRAIDARMNTSIHLDASEQPDPEQSMEIEEADQMINRQRLIEPPRIRNLPPISILPGGSRPPPQRPIHRFYKHRAQYAATNEPDDAEQYLTPDEDEDGQFVLSSSRSPSATTSSLARSSIHLPPTIDGGARSTNGRHHMMMTNDDVDRQSYNNVVVDDIDDDDSTGRIIGARGIDADLVIDQTANPNDDRVPLIPTDFSSIEEAIHNFTAVFEARYGTIRPNFFSGPLDAAIREAFDRPIIEERRPLLIYLHDDESIASHVFAQNVLASEPVTALVKAQFIIWAWDVTQAENKAKLSEWLKALNAHEIREAFGIVRRDRYPLLLVLTREKNVILPCQLAQGTDDATTVIDKLIFGLDRYQDIKHQDQTEERERIEREMMRQEQAAEYQKSLATDRTKKEENERRIAEELAQLRRTEEEQRITREKQEQLAASLPDEPSADAANVTTVRIRLPTGEQIHRRFSRDEPLRHVITYAASRGYPTDAYRLWNSDMPKCDLLTLDRNMTLAELRWPLREQITVEEK